MSTSAMFQEISRCRICGNTQLAEVLDLGTQALTHVFPRTKTQRVPAGPLRLVKCTGEPEVCGLLQLQHAYVNYKPQGTGDARLSVPNPRTLGHRRSTVFKALERVRLPHNALIVVVGANDGTTLPIGPLPGCLLAQFDPANVDFPHPPPMHGHAIPGA